MADTTTAGRAPAWMKLLLAASLALNLLIAGIVIGVHAGGDRFEGRDRLAPELRSLGYAPFFQALPEENRRELASTAMREIGSLRDGRRAARENFRELLGSLRATPYDPGAVAALTDAQGARLNERQALGRRLFLEQIAAMDDADRAAYADRLEEQVRHRRR